jgi:hypothetical protein
LFLLFYYTQLNFLIFLGTENPPNKILLLVDLPPDCDEKKLKVVFGNLPGLVEVRLIAGRYDVAFVEYENEYQASQAKSLLFTSNI